MRQKEGKREDERQRGREGWKDGGIEGRIEGGREGPTITAIAAITAMCQRRCVTYLVYVESHCLGPRTVRLQGHLPVGREGEEGGRDVSGKREVEGM